MAHLSWDRGHAPTRREFLGELAVVASVGASRFQPSPIPIIDTHIHLFDPTRPQGAPYSGPPGVPVEPSLPPRYRKLAAPPGIVGAIKIEASPWIEDNLWVLEVAERDPIIVGVVGNLEPDKPDFPEMLERYHKNRLFRGIRYGNLWGRDITKQAENPAFISGLKLLQQGDLVLDTANPRVDLLQAIVRITDKVPDLRQWIIRRALAIEPRIIGSHSGCESEMTAGRIPGDDEALGVDLILCGV